MREFPKLAFAGNRNIALRCLRGLLDFGWKPSLLLIPKSRNSDIPDQMAEFLPDVQVLKGKDFREPHGLGVLRELKPDYMISVHFPYIVPREVLAVPQIGTLNLHPALLPYNRGWHTPTWAIMESTPYGATLHWMDEGIDTGDIALQQEVSVQPDDTADSLYQRVLKAEYELFLRALPSIVSGDLPRHPQEPNSGTTHVKTDLAGVQELDLNACESVRDTLRRLRALTTSDPTERAHFRVGNQTYMATISIEPVPLEE